MVLPAVVFGESGVCPSVFVDTLVVVSSVSSAVRVNAVVDECPSSSVGPFDYFCSYESVAWAEGVGLLWDGEGHAEHER